jgi:hypothetical protein
MPQTRVLSCNMSSSAIGSNRRYFGKTVLVMCNVQALITSGILRIGVGADEEPLAHE